MEAWAAFREYYHSIEENQYPWPGILTTSPAHSGLSYRHIGFSVRVQAMQPIKAIFKFTFLSAFVLGFIGLWVGAVAAIFIWPESNLGPPAGALYGIFVGVLLGAVLGFVFGIIRSQKSRVAREEPERTERAP